MAYYFGQDIATKLSQAETYYDEANHLKAYDWAQYTDNEKKAALNQSEREINLYLGADLEETYSTTEFPQTWNPNFRPDYACFEQALFLLENTNRTATDTSGARLIETDEAQMQEESTGLGLAPQTTRYLQMNRIQISRG